MSMQALQGVRVLDLSHVIAGPTASHYLALVAPPLCFLYLAEARLVVQVAKYDLRPSETRLLSWFASLSLYLYRASLRHCLCACRPNLC